MDVQCASHILRSDPRMVGKHYRLALKLKSKASMTFLQLNTSTDNSRQKVSTKSGQVQTGNKCELPAAQLGR